MSWLALVNNKLHVSRAGDLIICEESHVRSEFFSPVGPFVQCWVAATRTTLAKAQITVVANSLARAVQIMVDELALNKELTLLAAVSDQHVQAAFTSKVKELAVDPVLEQSSHSLSLLLLLWLLVAMLMKCPEPLTTGWTTRVVLSDGSSLMPYWWLSTPSSRELISTCKRGSTLTRSTCGSSAQVIL